MPVQCTCSACGKIVSRSPSRANRGRLTYCSRTCRPRSAVVVSADGSTATVHIGGGDGSGAPILALIDAGDAEYIGQFHWSIDASGYATRTVTIEGRSQYLRMHRDILGLTPGDPDVADHINRKKLDNRRSNLRAIPSDGNHQNVPSYAGASSHHRGVYWDKKNRKWRAQIVVNRKAITLGRFSTEDEAAAVAREARSRMMPYTVD